MKYKLSAISLMRLKGVHPKLVELVLAAIKTSPIDFRVDYGVRTAQEQFALFKAGRSKCDGKTKKSNHQVKPDGYGYAVDLLPLPIEWNNKQAFKTLASHIKETAKKMNIRIQWGGDWTSFVDMPHYELI